MACKHLSGVWYLTRRHGFAVPRAPHQDYDADMDIVRASFKAGLVPGLSGLLCGLLCSLSLVAGPVGAQGVPYKVTGPDGRVTYTDRPDARAQSVRPLGAAAAAAPADAGWLDALPFGLRQVAQRYPVTLYTGPGCTPCDMGRQLLQRRGVPFREWAVPAGAGAELQRREGTDSLPVLRVGREQLLGFEAGAWRQTLDAAGYPKSGSLPSGWQAPAVQSLAAPGAPGAAGGGPATERESPQARVTAPPPTPEPAPGGFRF